MTYLKHITLSSGLLRPWLAELVASGERRPLPAPALAHSSASAVVQVGLVVTIWCPRGRQRPGTPVLDGIGIPLVTLGVARRSRQGRDLWAALVASFGAHPAARRPAEPWLAVAVHESAAAHPEALVWLGDLERCMAWAWITLEPDLGAAS